MARTTTVVKEGERTFVVVTTSNEDGNDSRTQKQPITEALVLQQLLGLAQQRESLAAQLKAVDEESAFWKGIMADLQAPPEA